MMKPVSLCFLNQKTLWPAILQAGNRKACICLALLYCLMVFMTACKDNTSGSDQNPPGGTDGLFLSLTGDPNGLYLLDTQTGKATRSGAGHTSANNDADGLASRGSSLRLIGASRFALYEIALDGSSATLIGDPTGQALTEGLAFDSDSGVLYASSNGFLRIRSPTTGETIETVLRPPNQPDIEGLAFDVQTRTLYGLARGFEAQPQFRRGLFVLDVDKPQNEWTWQEVGDTGGLWMNAGLAFDASAGVLYAVGRADDPAGLYRINPETGNTARIGGTGLPIAQGGLAWVPAE